MALGIISALGGLASLMVEGIRDHFQGKQEIKKAVVENKIRLAKSSQEFNHTWEMKQLEQTGLKDDVLFYAWLGFFVWSGFHPEEAGRVLQAWELLPDWFLEITFWLVAAVLGVKKIGETLPATVRGLRQALSRETGRVERDEEGRDEEEGTNG